MGSLWLSGGALQLALRLSAHATVNRIPHHGIYCHFGVCRSGIVHLASSTHVCLCVHLHRNSIIRSGCVDANSRNPLCRRRKPREAKSAYTRIAIYTKALPRFFLDQRCRFSLWLEQHECLLRVFPNEARLAGLKRKGGRASKAPKEKKPTHTPGVKQDMYRNAIFHFRFGCSL